MSMRGCRRRQRGEDKHLQGGPRRLGARARPQRASRLPVLRHHRPGPGMILFHALKSHLRHLSPAVDVHAQRMLNIMPLVTLRPAAMH